MTVDTLTLKPDPREMSHAARLAELHAAFDNAEPAASEPDLPKPAPLAPTIPERIEPATPQPTVAVVPASFINHDQNYFHTLASIQRKLPSASLAFSKVIHAPAVEKVSELIETTIARPSVLFGATWTALIVGASFYLVARHYGYTLSGSELLFSFIVGALIGIAGEGLWRVTRRH